MMNVKAIRHNGKDVKQIKQVSTGKVIWSSEPTPIPDYEILPDGTWKIYTETGLLAFKAQVETVSYATNAILAKDIVLANTWDTIGSYLNENTRYTGTFDGDNYKIINMTVNSPTTNGASFISGTNGATIKNLFFENINIIGQDNCSGIAGVLYGNSTIENVHILSGQITGKYGIGGIVGNSVTGSNIIACTNNATITNTDRASVGGIIGVCAVNVYCCYNLGVIIGTSQVGGIVGGSGLSSNRIKSCYNTGTLQGTSSVGGIIGFGGGVVSRNYYVSLTNIGSISGVARVSNIQQLNDVVWLMNNELEDENINYRYVKGTNPSTDVPTLVKV